MNPWQGSQEEGSLLEACLAGCRLPPPTRPPMALTPGNRIDAFVLPYESLILVAADQDGWTHADPLLLSRQQSASRLVDRIVTQLARLCRLSEGTIRSSFSWHRMERFVHACFEARDAIPLEVRNAIRACIRRFGNPEHTGSAYHPVAGQGHSEPVDPPCEPPWVPGFLDRQTHEPAVVLLRRLYLENGTMVIDDLLTYPAGFARWIYNSVFSWYTSLPGSSLSLVWYRLLIAATPRWLRRLCQNVPISEGLLAVLRNGACPFPKTAFQWAMLSTWTNPSFQARFLEPPAFRTALPVWEHAFLRRLALAKAGPWLPGEPALPGLRPARPLTDPQLQADALLSCIEEGRMIYQCVQGANLKPVPRNLSLAKQYQRAAWNHRRLKQIRLDELLCLPDRELPAPRGLAGELETLRIKTVHGLVRAGAELDTCLATYTESSDVFLRRGTVCLQLEPHTGRIVQCVDARNSCTAASREFAAFVAEMVARGKAPVNGQPVYENGDRTPGAQKHPAN